MAIAGPGVGIFRFEYSGDGVVVAGRVEFMAVPVPGLGIPGLAEIRGVRFEYSGGGVAADGGGVEGMAIPSPGLGSYSSLFMSWAGAASSAWRPATASRAWRSQAPAWARSCPCPRCGRRRRQVRRSRRWRRGHGDPKPRPGLVLVLVHVVGGGGVEFMAVPVHGLGIPSLPEIRGRS